MKKIFAVFMISSLLFIFTACGQTEKALPTDPDKSTQQDSIRNESPDTGKDEPQSTETQRDNTPTTNTYKDDGDSKKADDKADSGTKPITGIIAKSDNIVASQDKAAILKELDKELDELLSSMNELEDLQDTDLE